MGMAASQARLLSITSRMADNELRSQLINNAKMRLTEDSSKASEKYINALNKTQLMMSNKDALGNNMYQQLTFNNLTSYSSYNNQYGMINKSGELVVSELEAAKYEQAVNAAKNNTETDALSEFLKSYGLEKASTTYWESNGISDDMKTRYEGDVEYDDNANRISGLHYGYDKSLISVEKSVYDTLLSDYISADKAYTSAVSKKMKEYLKNYIPSGQTIKYEDKYDAVVAGATTPTTAEAMGSLGYLRSMFNELLGSRFIKDEITGNDGQKGKNPFVDIMDYYLNDSIKTDGSGNAIIMTDATIENTPSGYAIKGYVEGGDEDYEATLFEIKGVAPNYNVSLGGDAKSDPNHSYSINSGVTNNGGEYSFTYTDTYKEVDADGNETTKTQNRTCVFKTSPLEAHISMAANQDDVAQAVEEIYKYFQRNILSQLDRDKFASMAPQEKLDYENASRELSKFIFGKDIGAENYENLGNMEWIMNCGTPTTNLNSNDTVTIKQNINGTFVNMDYPANFEAILDIYLVDQMIDTFGAPNYTWIDKNNKNENADAKVRWYTNIFEKMQESGYQKINLDLCNSADWIQFAFESGLLSMVQVDDENRWVSTMYSNCSDITEDTIDIEVTRAEAEYKRETNKIQAKDKRYDLELKNIDTEHNSLQTEYDSIKAVIDKNVERNFKIFG